MLNMSLNALQGKKMLYVSLWKSVNVKCESINVYGENTWDTGDSVLVDCKVGSLNGFKSSRSR